jgi:hypothetical protein
VSETKEPKKRCRGNLPAVATAGSVARAADSEATVGEQEPAEATEGSAADSEEAVGEAGAEAEAEGGGGGRGGGGGGGGGVGGGGGAAKVANQSDG